MMIVLYSVGNVKLQLKKIGRNLYVNDLDRFIFIYIKRKEIYLATVQKITDDRWQIVHFHKEQIQENNEDIYFYQEVLYRFCREQEREKIKYLAINFADEWQKHLAYNFPQIPIAEVEKALYWELKEDIDIEKYCYTYDIKVLKDGYDINVALLDKELIAMWQRIAEEQNLEIMSIFASKEIKIYKQQKDEYISVFSSREDDNFFSCELQIDREYIQDEQEQIEIFDDFCKLLVCFVQKKYQEFLPKKQLISYFNWKNIYLLLITVLLSISCFFGGFLIAKYYRVVNQAQIVKEELALVQRDIDDINELKQEESTIKEKQNLVKTLEDKSINIYAILINLGAKTVDNVALNDIKVKGKEIFIKGKAKDYQSIAQYKEKLTEIKFFATSEMGEIKFNENDNLIDFEMNIVMR